MRIQSAEEQASVRNAGGYRAFVSNVVQSRHHFKIDWEDVANDARELRAHVSRGDWVVQCDLLANTAYACKGSIVCSVHDPLMICDECCNHEYGNKVRPVTFPNNTDRLIIEELLTNRPHPGLRNWQHETIAEMQEANIKKFWLDK